MFNQDIDINLLKASADQRQTRPNQNNLAFGKFIADHMFTMCWNRQKGWHDAKIEPYVPLQLSPAAMVFHYGQAIFEGLKAYRGKDGCINLFRPLDNLRRMNDSAVRLCMPRLPEQAVLKALKALVYLDQEWIPEIRGASLYIRPTMIATEPMLGLRPSEEYLFFIITSPVGNYYSEGFNPTRIHVEDNYVRAVPGGVGSAKFAGNYAASELAQVEAEKKGYTQVLWLDAVERKYVEEVGTSNIFFKINGEVITPPLGGSILPGITRDSVIQLCRGWDLPVVERKITVDEVMDACADGRMEESFGTGTAAVISPVGEFNYRDRKAQVNNGQIGPLSRQLFENLQDIQYGFQEDSRGWVVRVR
ncbi:MAG: branched chain amino acid aminotransferase [Desulfobulbus propionicus]|nr:MAG: branched chain amino acid aminotransferase [Desulfobulbus propionicus]